MPAVFIFIFIFILFFLFLSGEVRSEERISPLQVHNGIRMELTRSNLSSIDALEGIESCGDATMHRIATMVKRSQERITRLVLSSSFISPLSSGGGDYVTTLYLGTPPHKYTLIADTGSDLIWLQCKPCESCFKQDEPIFDPTTSTSYSTRSCNDGMCRSIPERTCMAGSQECTYRYGYGDGSGTRGTLASETLALTSSAGATVKVKGVALGCGHRNKGMFTHAAGLLGLGRGKLSFVSQLGSMFGRRFSYCLVPWKDASDKSSEMIFGRDSARFPEGEEGEEPVRLSFTPMISNEAMQSFYYVKLEDISVGGVDLGFPKGTFDINEDGSGGIIFDSGTTLTLLQDSAYDRVVRAFKSKVNLPTVDGSSVGLDLCYDISRVKSSYRRKFPSLTFLFDGADQKLPLENYFITVDEQGSILCLAMAASGMDIGIIGNIQQQNFRVVYDSENEQIGWTPAKCDKKP